MIVGFCLDCEESIPVGSDPFIGQKVTCAKCGAYLEVSALSPLEFEWVFDYEDDELIGEDEGWDDF
ncbi:MAG: hypothetical protein GTO18_16860 [Anaerolineales bacterium]|nr:hypothetical protein [Anaerolineales bacterium]